MIEVDISLGKQTTMLTTSPAWIRTTRNLEGAIRGIIALISMLAAGVDASESLDCLIEPNVVIELSSSEIGVLASVHVDEADIVRKGDVIAALHTDVEQAALEVSRERARAKTEIQLLQRDHEFNVRKRDRFDELHVKQVVSAQDVDEVRTAQDAARLRLQAAAEKRRAIQLEAVREELALARRTVLSPIDGVVVRKHKNAGEYVDGDPIVKLVQLDPLRIEVVVPITMFGQIEVGMQATVLPELPLDGPFVAIVTSIDPTMDAATATFGVRLSLPNPNHRLPPGLKCSLVLHTLEEPVKNAESKRKHPAEIESATAQALPNEDLIIAAAYAANQPDTISEPLSQTDSNLNVTTVDSTSDSNTQKTAAPVNSICVTLGPLHGSSNAEKLTALLNTSDIKFAHRARSDKNATAPWTVLSREPHTNPDQLLKSLRRAGITDVQWFKTGPWKHRVSYGRYGENKNAQDRLKKLLELGFDALLMPKSGSESTLWFDLAHGPSDPLLIALIPNLGSRFPDLTVQPVSCPQLARRQ